VSLVGSCKGQEPVETTNVVFAEDGKVGYLFRKGIPNKQAISNVGLNFFNCLTHGANAEQVLNEYHFNENNRVDTRSSIVKTVFIFDQVIDELKINGLFNLPN
jgi:hypothetical protein